MRLPSSPITSVKCCVVGACSVNCDESDEVDIVGGDFWGLEKFEVVEKVDV